ncbi:MAG TPA: hypothetical protein VFC31_04305 [Candidatus Limnocylindria bacterium]|nr:hypothetical protein [Candidatus Limnocylindria bacterium]
MRGSRAARLASLAAILASAAAIAYLVFFLFGPTYAGCSTGIVSPTATPGPITCRSIGWLEMEFGSPHPGPVDLRPIAFLTAWTAAPVAAVVGTRLRSRGVGITLVALAFLVDASSIVSMGGGFMFALLCAPLLLVSFAALMVAFTQERMG